MGCSIAVTSTRNRKKAAENVAFDSGDLSSWAKDRSRLCGQVECCEEFEPSCDGSSQGTLGLTGQAAQEVVLLAASSAATFSVDSCEAQQHQTGVQSAVMTARIRLMDRVFFTADCLSSYY